MNIGGMWGGPTITEVAGAVNTSRATAQRLEISGLEKIRQGLKGVKPSEFITAFREGVLNAPSQDWEDAIIRATAEELGLPEPTWRFESLADTLRALFGREAR
jgi:hypothetical protein